MVREDVIIGYARKGTRREAVEFIQENYLDGCVVDITIRAPDFTANELVHVLAYGSKRELYALNFKEHKYEYADEADRWHEFHLTNNEAYALRAYLKAVMEGLPVPYFWPQIQRNIARRTKALHSLALNITTIVEPL